MKNTHAYGIPHSIFFENLFAKTYDPTKLEEDKERIREAYQDEGLLHGPGPRPDDRRSCDNGGHGFRIPLLRENTPGQSRGHHDAGGRGPPVPPAQDQLRGRQAVPHA